MASRADRSYLFEFSTPEDREDFHAAMRSMDVSGAQFLRKCAREHTLIAPILGFGPRSVDEKAAA